VAVAPEFVGAGALLVDEGGAGIDVGDVGEPGLPEAGSEADLEPEHLAGEDGGGLIATGAAHGEVGWGEAGEVGGVGEEVPGGGGGDGQGLGLVEGVEDHKEGTPDERGWFGIRG
jgi:hypothetical protein